jgi:hypothetical protein
MDANRLKNIVQQLGLDVPVLRVKEDGRRICLYLYSGGLVELENEQGWQAPSPQAADKAEGQTAQRAPRRSAPVQAKAPGTRRKKDGHD